MCDVVLVRHLTPHDDGFAIVDEETSMGQIPDDREHVTSSRASARAVAATVADILKSNRAAEKTTEPEVSTEPVVASNIVLSSSPVSVEQDDQDDQDAIQGETLSDSQDEVEPVHQPTLEEAQAIRNESYITFESEDAEDYTQGPARFVLATDGVQDCVVLLLTMDLSLRIQKALRMQHAFEQAERAGLRKRQAYMRFERRSKPRLQIAGPS
jgi:hypothetical protein